MEDRKLDRLARMRLWWSVCWWGEPLEVWGNRDLMATGMTLGSVMSDMRLWGWGYELNSRGPWREALSIVLESRDG